MRQIAIFLLVMGIGSFVLPMMGLQFRLMSIFGGASSMVAIGCIIVGGVLLAISLKRGDDEE
jgi:hypothetical protein